MSKTDKIQKIGCKVYDCRFCNCDENCCSLDKIEVCNCNDSKNKEATMCNSYKKQKKL